MASSTIKAPAIVVAAVLINVLMFTAIETMIGKNSIRLTEVSDVRIADFIRVSEPSRRVSSRRDPKAPQKPLQQMQQEIATAAASTASAAGDVGFSIQAPEIEIDIGSSIQVARELTPLVRIPAEYPLRALAKKIEGFVDMRFTVTEAGTVANPEVIRSDPEGLFEQAATRAVLKWKYQPQLADGKPVPVMTYTRLTFRMANEAAE